MAHTRLVILLSAALGCVSPVDEYRVIAECEGPSAAGAYQLVLPNGVVQIEGRFAAGEPSGVFIIRMSSGEKVGEIPYAGNKIHGTVRLWYTPDSGSTLKIESSYVSGYLEGTTSSWYPSGARRAVTTYSAGRPVVSEGWLATGEPLSTPRAALAAAAGRDADREYYRQIRAVIDENPPTCPTSPAA